MNVVIFTEIFSDRIKGITIYVTSSLIYVVNDWTCLRGVALLDISCLEENVHGIKSIILVKEKKVIEVRGTDKELDYLLGCISHLCDFFHDKRKDVKKICITAHDQFFVFFQGPYILSVLASSDINAPLLGLVSNRMLTYMETPPVEDKEEGESQEEIPFFLRLSISDYYKRYPKSEESDDWYMENWSDLPFSIEYFQHNMNFKIRWIIEQSVEYNPRIEFLLQKKAFTYASKNDFKKRRGFFRYASPLHFSNMIEKSWFDNCW